MENKNELNDIILNKNAKNNSTKKILLTIATFAITLIIVVIIMNQVSGKKESNLPHAPQMSEVVVEEVVQEPEMEVAEESIPIIEKSIEHESELVEEDEVTENVKSIDVPDGKDETERIFEEVFEEPEIIKEPVYTSTPQKSSTKSATVKPLKKAEPKQAVQPKTVLPSGKYDPKTKRVVQSKAPAPSGTGQYYIQVGSFAKYAPSKAFLDKIANRGYTYTFHKVTRSGKTLNKVLVGPFKTQAAAREALPIIKRNVESGAFLTKI